MEVNDEMRALEGMLPSIPLMHKGGRLVVITYPLWKTGW